MIVAPCLYPARFNLFFGGPLVTPGGSSRGANGGFPKLGVPSIMENQMEKKMENEMETGFI